MGRRAENERGGPPSGREGRPAFVVARCRDRAAQAPVSPGGATARLVAEVVFADTGQAEQIASPFQAARYQNVGVGTRDPNGDGVPDEVVFTATKGKRTVTAAVRG